MLHQQVLLLRDLLALRQMLHTAPAANAEMGATRRHAMGRRGEDFNHPALGKITFDEGVDKAEFFAGQAAVDEHGFAVHMRHPAQVVGEGFDAGLDRGFGKFFSVGAFGHGARMRVRGWGLTLDAGG